MGLCAEAPGIKAAVSTTELYRNEERESRFMNFHCGLHTCGCVGRRGGAASQAGAARQVRGGDGALVLAKYGLQFCVVTYMYYSFMSPEVLQNTKFLTLQRNIGC
jgi:hypothetical protein